MNRLGGLITLITNQDLVFFSILLIPGITWANLSILFDVVSVKFIFGVTQNIYESQRKFGQFTTEAVMQNTFQSEFREFENVI